MESFPPPDVRSYRLLGALGTGGMAGVHAAERESGGDLAAIKLLLPEHVHEPHLWAGAVETLLRRVQPWLILMATRYTGEFAPGGIRAADVSQGAAEKVLAHLPSFQEESEGQLRAWLGQVVYSSWADMVRKATRSRRNEGGAIALDDAEALEVTAPQRGPSLVAAQREQWRILLAQIKTLPAEDREVLSSHYFHGLSLADIRDKRQSSSTEAVSSLPRRAVRRLRDHLQGREVSTDANGAMTHDQLDAGLASYIRQREEGTAPKLEDFVAHHPGCADELRGVLLLMETLERSDSND